MQQRLLICLIALVLGCTQGMAQDAPRPAGNDYASLIALFREPFTARRISASGRRSTAHWMGTNDSIARFDLELYLRQPGYGIGYYIGKVQLEALLAERAAELGRNFDLKKFHDDFLAAGVIPISLIRWEMTGKADQVQTMR